MWDRTEGLTILGSLGGTVTATTASNNLGEVVGSSATAIDETFAILWDADGGTRSLGSLDGVYSQANGINEVGQICGYAMDAQYVQYAVVWNPDSTVTLLDGPSGWIEARDINDAGVAVGLTGNLPVRWTPAGALEPLGDVIALGWTHAINAEGDICGASDLPGSQVWTEAVVWESDGSFRPLGAWNISGSDALGINDDDLVVGWTGTYLYGPTTAILWTPTGEMVELSDHAPPGWRLEKAVAINARGDIAGIARSPEGVEQAFVLWFSDPAGVDDGSLDRAGVASLRAFPNPSSGRVQLTIDGSRAGRGVLRVIDILGREVDAVDLVLEAGGSDWVWNAESRGGSLPRGRYAFVVDPESGPRLSGSVLLMPTR